MYSVPIAYLLWFLGGCGIFGLHRFYLGKIPTGILWACTGGLGMIGAIYDFFTLPRQVQEANLKRAILSSNQVHIHNYGTPWADISIGGKTAPVKDDPEHTILRIAKENKGVVTPSDVALAAHISLDEARKNLDALVSKGFADMRVRKTGSIVYTIPEMLDNDAPLEDI
jgi:TM2 domain-containing membrane protein YozV